MRSHRGLALAVAAVASLAVPFEAVAQALAPGEEARGINVTNRPRPGFDPLGIRAGTFTVRPFAGISSFYDTNVFVASRNGTRDFAVRPTAGVNVASDWSRHRLYFLGNVVETRYIEEEDERYTDWQVETGGRYDLTPDTSLRLQTYRRVTHEERGDINTPAAARAPIEQEQTAIFVGAATVLNRLTPEVEVGFERRDYKDGTTIRDLPIDQDQRDRDTVSTEFGLNYRFGELRTLFVTLGGAWVDYTGQPAGATDNDYFSTTASIGVNFDSDGVFAYRAEVGYRWNDYAEPGLETVGGYTVNVAGDWNITSLTTIRLELFRDLDDAAQGVGQSVTRNRGTLQVFHELFRNVILTGAAQVRYEEFDDEVDARDREDTIYRASAGVRFLVNRNLSLDLSAAYDTRESNVALREYDRTVILIGARFAL